MPSARTLELQTVPCPRCGAEAGHPCHGYTAGSGSTHVARKVALRQADAKRKADK